MKVLLAIFCIMSLKAQIVRVATSANAGYAIEEIVEQFHKRNSKIDIQIILGGTGKLVTQILHGAPYDILLAADMLYPEVLHDKKLAISKPKVYARGALILLSPTARDLSSGLDILLSKDIRKIAVSNPKTAPYGKASFEAIKKYGILNKIKSKFVYGESISQTVTFALKAADLGIVSKSSIYSPKLSDYKKEGYWKEIDTTLYTPIDQGVVLLKNAKDNQAAKEFYKFIFSDEAGKIFAKYGYTLP